MCYNKGINSISFTKKIKTIYNNFNFSNLIKENQNAILKIYLAKSYFYFDYKDFE